MIELFIELTNQIYWEGYAEQLARESPATFQQELNRFMDSYNPNNDKPRQQLTKISKAMKGQKNEPSHIRYPIVDQNRL